jgi:ABC-2 type transport system ATP-binding protein
MSMSFLIEARNISKSFRSTKAVNDLSVIVSAGEIYGLVGPDGAGKTTTLRLLCGALKADEGEIRIAGFDIAAHVEQARAQIGYLPQRFSLYEDLTVIENIRFFAEVRGLTAHEWRPRCMEILQFVGLEKFIDRRAGHLSGGMRQKLGLAAALVHQPRVLLLDEPTTGVDPVTRQDFWRLIIRLVSLTSEPANNGKEPVAVLVSTPYMDEAARCARVGFMKNGNMMIEGPPEDLRKRLTGRVLELQGKPLPLIRQIAKADSDVEDAQLFGDRIHIRVKEGKSKDVISRITEECQTQGGEISRIEETSPQLEDFFIYLLEKQD